MEIGATLIGFGFSGLLMIYFCKKKHFFSLMYTSGMERISRIQGFADYKIIQERFASPSGGLVECKKESVVFVEVTFPSEDKVSV